jgi:SAM-dependent methyltransferase
MKRIVRHFCELPSAVRKPLWRFLHYWLMRFDQDRNSLFLNYGYAQSNGEPFGLALTPEELPHQNSIQLYHHLTLGCGLRNRRVLEVGCGRGGGAAFLARQQGPVEYVGLDIAAGTIAFCNRLYQVKGLSFMVGEAESIPFTEGRFDVVINVESARCYGNLGEFFREVFRVLEPGGWFLMADMIRKEDVEGVEELASETGFETVRKDDIREKVILALETDSQQRKKLIDARVPGFLRRGFYEFAGIVGSDRYNAFVNGEFHYLSFTMRKPSQPPRPPGQPNREPQRGESP